MFCLGFFVCEIVCVYVLERKKVSVCVCAERVHVYMKESERKSVYFLLRVFLYV